MQRNPFRFEKLEVWQLARRFNRRVYAAAKTFPETERYALCQQLRRASVSVSSNIAEGSGRNSDIDFAHFLEIAYGSLMEVVSQLFIASDEGYLDGSTLDSLLTDADLLAAKLVSLSKSLGRQFRTTLRPSESSDASVPRRSTPRPSTPPRPSNS